MWKKIVVFTFLMTFLLSAKVSNYQDKYFEITKNLEIFTNIYKELNKYYVDEIDPSALMRTGIDAMVHSLDPYTVYYSENELERYRYMTEGKYDGIGAQVEEIDGLITIKQPYKGYAADEAGLKAGDQIIAVEGKSVRDMTSEEVNLLMKGVSGTELEITVQRPGKDEPITVTLDREEVNVPNVPHSELLDEDIAYVNLSTFTHDAAKNVNKAIQELKKQNEGISAIILDIRHNGGGLLGEAVELSNLFIPQGKVVVSTRSKVKEWDKVYKTRRPVVYDELPLIVLVDNRSASASEIVSGVIQDYDRGVIMGQKTYGKGLVQNIKEVGYNSRVKLTTSKYYIPSGRCIQSVAYEDGEPLDIPDSLRAVFHTENGREVLDGGGIHPDIILSTHKESEIVKALEDNHMIFRFVTDYVQDIEDIEDTKDYSFKDYDQFLDYLNDSKFEFAYEAEKELDELEEVAKEASYYDDIKDDIEEARAEIKEEKRRALKTKKDIISALIAEEIVARFEYQEGRLIKRLQYDPEIIEAIDLIKDKKRYQEILSKS
jgi:carboxyl-terminal processing protease